MMDVGPLAGARGYEAFGARGSIWGGCPASHEAGYGRGTGRSEARWGGCPASHEAGYGVRGVDLGAGIGRRADDER